MLLATQLTQLATGREQASPTSWSTCSFSGLQSTPTRTTTPPSSRRTATPPARATPPRRTEGLLDRWLLGGASNAYTAFENTNYHFEVLPAHLPGALDRFAQFFIAPLFTESGASRERSERECT